MKYLIVIIWLSFINLNATQNGGSVNNNKYILKNLENQQIKILENLKDINRFLGRYISFLNDYRAEMTDIIKSGARCIKIKHEYIGFRNMYGENHIDTRFNRKIYNNCLNMKKIRLAKLKALNGKFDGLKTKVNKLEKRKHLSVRKANFIREDIRSIKRTLSIVTKYNEL